MKTSNAHIVSFRKAAWFAAVFVALYFIILTTVRDDDLRIVYSNIYFPIQKLLAGAALLYAARHTTSRQPNQARSWYLWMFGIASYAIADIIWAVLELRGLEPFPSIADIFYLLFYPLMWVGLVIYPIDKVQSGDRKFLHLDNFIVIIGSGLSMWNLLIAPTVNSDAPDLLSYGLGVLYPVLGMVLLWVVLTFYRNRLQQSVNIPILLIGMGIVGEITSDTLFAITIDFIPVDLGSI